MPSDETPDDLIPVLDGPVAALLGDVRIARPTTSRVDFPMRSALDDRWILVHYDVTPEGLRWRSWLRTKGHRP